MTAIRHRQSFDCKIANPFSQSPTSPPDYATCQLPAYNENVTPDTATPDTAYDAENGVQVMRPIKEQCMTKTVPGRHSSDDVNIDLDLLISQTSCILLASSECLAQTVDAHERFMQYHATDDILQRSMEHVSLALERGTRSLSRYESRLMRLNDEIHSRLDNLGFPRLPKADGRPAMDAFEELEHVHGTPSRMTRSRSNWPAPQMASFSSAKSSVVPSLSDSSTVMDDDDDSHSTVEQREQLEQTPSFARSFYTSLFGSVVSSPPANAANAANKGKGKGKGDASPSAKELLARLAATRPSASTASSPGPISSLADSTSDVFDDPYTPSKKSRPSYHHRKSSSQILNGNDEPVRARLFEPKEALLHATGSIRNDASLEQVVTAQQRLRSLCALT